MKAFFLMLLKQAVIGLLKKELPDITLLVIQYLESDLPGDEKRRLVIQKLRIIGSTTATWLLGIGVDYVYGQLANKPTEKTE